MPLMTKNAASKLPYAPKPAHFTQQQKKENPPAYLVEHNGKIMVDTDSDSWAEFIARRKDEYDRGVRRGNAWQEQRHDDVDSGGNNGGGKSDNNGNGKKGLPVTHLKTDTAGTDDEIDELRQKSNKAKLLEPILKAESMQHKIEMNKLELQKEAGNLIEYQLAEFLFNGYLEKMNIEVLKLPDKVDPIIRNYCKENKPNEIIKLFKRELETILVEIKRAQKEDVKKWREEK